ncbi:hypothetical protein H2248_005795 [Termitomyces sp. 'cryptogamus']|nr:hypothetical protein H2248_005795 [Termitomyces sp. 'cryptogamus']
MLYITALVGALWGFTHTSARPGSAHVVVERIGYPHDAGLLNARQSDNPDVPSQCKSTCDPVNTAIANNCTPQQCCTATFETQYYNCLVCFGSALNATDYSGAQAVLKELEQECAAHGLGIPTLTLPGQGSSGPTNPPATSTFASTTSGRSQAGLSSSASTQLSTLSVPSTLTSRVVQQTVTVDTRTSVPTFASTTVSPSTSTTAAAGNGAPTMRVHVFGVWATILTYVIVVIGYHW